QLRDSLDAFVRLGVRGAVVELLTIDETHDVGVLLDRPGLAQVRQLGAPVLAAPLLGGARELGQRHHRHVQLLGQGLERAGDERDLLLPALGVGGADRKSTRLNSSHVKISYAVFCLKKKKKIKITNILVNHSVNCIL